MPLFKQTVFREKNQSEIRMINAELKRTKEKKSKINLIKFYFKSPKFIIESHALYKLYYSYSLRFYAYFIFLDSVSVLVYICTDVLEILAVWSP